MRTMGIGGSLMVTAHDIREKVLAHLAGSLDLDTFEDWIAQNTWNIHQWGASAAQNLAYTVELRLSEYSTGHLTDLDLRKHLADAVLASVEGTSVIVQDEACSSSDSGTLEPTIELIDYQVV